MQRRSFNFGYSDAVVLDTAFPIPSNYIYVPEAGVGNIVYENSAGEAQYFQSAGAGYHPIAAARVLTGATVRGIARTTTATGLNWCAGG